MNFLQAKLWKSVTKSTYLITHLVNCFTVLSLSLFLMSCATVNYDYALPDQSIDKPAEAGKTRVIFYNGLNPLFLDGSWRIGIKIDDVGVHNLHINKYVQLFLEPGEYKLGLSHVDVFTFQDEYPFKVTGDSMYVKVYNGLVSTKFEIQKAEPEGFRSKYRPVEVPL